MKYLIAGLGNIGPDYVSTRHNVGFEIADALVKDLGGIFEPGKLAFHSSVKFKGRTLVVIKPTTYMNLSGKAVRYWMQQEKIDLNHLLVLVDELALPFGTIRIRGKGSDGGHNGLSDIQTELQTASYARLRFGIGNEFGRGQQINYVLGKWNDEELAGLPERIDVAIEAVKSFCSIGLAHTMNLYNNK